MIDCGLRILTAQHMGRLGEDAAAAHLVAQGMTVLNRNWRKGHLELDIICMDGDTVVFVEVKTRRATGLATPADAMNLRKRHAMIRAARAWLATKNAWAQPCRFDLVAIVYDENSRLTLEHCPHVLELTASVGSRNTPWQPW